MPFRFGTLALLFAAALAAGCATDRPRSAALHTVQVGDRSDTLVVMLPGIRDTAEQFLVAGFVDAAAAPFDVLVVEPQMKHYVRGTLVERLREDVIAPARARYDEIWLLGVSIGGYGSLLYAGEFPADIRGVVLLAPYLGGRRVPRAIEAAGGLDDWRAVRGSPFVRAWRALKALTQPGGATIVLGFGESDRLAATYAPLLDALPQSQVYVAEGGHGWATWTPLWREIRASVDSLAHAD